MIATVDWGQAVLVGPWWVAAAVSVLAGLVSFASPCILPLVPGYLAYVAGVSGTDELRRNRARTVTASALFVVGFSVVFVAFAVVAGAAGAWLARWDDIILRVMGVLVIVMGLLALEVIPALHTPQIQWRPKPGLWGAPLLGAVLAVGWGPCIGPVLGAVLSMGFAGGDVVRAVVLASLYCLGLGLPFVAIGAALGPGLRAVKVIGRHRRWIARAGGVVLLIVGVLMVTGLWIQWMDWLRTMFGSFETVL